MPHGLIIPKHSMAWRIKARFSGGLPPMEYLTPDIRSSNPGWGEEVFSRTIESLEFYLPTGHLLILSGMEAYNFFVEASQSLSGSIGARIEAFWLCGKLPHQALVEMWRIGQGKVIRQRSPWGQEWGGGPTTGWKIGGLNTHTISMILEGH